ncbi:hypothetical protein ACQP3C_29610, partial [Escherichia coli]
PKLNFLCAIFFCVSLCTKFICVSIVVIDKLISSDLYFLILEVGLLIYSDFSGFSDERKM